jgi:hypothetical protein
VKKLENFKCEDQSQNYLEIGYKKDKTPSGNALKKYLFLSHGLLGARLYCIESYPYLIEGDYDTEVMVIVNSAQSGLTVEIEYQASKVLLF